MLFFCHFKKTPVYGRQTLCPKVCLPRYTTGFPVARDRLDPVSDALARA